MIHNIILQSCVLVSAIIIAGVKSLDLRPDQLYDHHKKSDKHNNIDGRQVTALLHLQQVLQSNLLILNIFVLTFLAASEFNIYQDVAFAFVWLVGVHLLANTELIQKRAQAFTKKHLVKLLHLAAGLQPALALLDDSRFLALRNQKRFYSRAELLEAILESKAILTSSEKKQIEAIITEPTHEQSASQSPAKAEAKTETNPESASAA